MVAPPALLTALLCDTCEQHAAVLVLSSFLSLRMMSCLYETILVAIQVFFSVFAVFINVVGFSMSVILSSFSIPAVLSIVLS